MHVKLWLIVRLKVSWDGASHIVLMRLKYGLAEANVKLIRSKGSGVSQVVQFAVLGLTKFLDWSNLKLNYQHLLF